MNKKQGFSLLQVLCVLAIVGLMCAGAAIAGQVYEREQVTLGTTGTNVWTNLNSYAAIQLVRFEAIKGLYAADTITVSRVTAGDTSAITNTVGSILLSSGAGGSNLVTAAGSGPSYLEYGDKLRIVSGNGSNATVNIEYIIQKH
jgi:type II secretory pathway pseudopilin PulG